MNVSTLPRTTERIQEPYSSILNIKMYDRDNLYPQNVMKLLCNSSTALTCWSRFADFIEGDGVKSEKLAAFPVNNDGQTLNELHQLIAQDMARFKGFAILAEYDINRDVCGLRHVPFEQCRLEECDDRGKVNHIVVHQDWTGKSTKSGSIVRVDEENCDYYDIYNPDKEIVTEQMINADGITKYKGQIYYYSADGYMVYPTAPYDASLTEFSTDTGLSNVMNRNVKSNFLPSGALAYYGSKTDETDEIAENLQALQGDMNAGVIFGIQVESKEEMPQFIDMKLHNFDKDFTATNATVTERIYSAFGQEGWHALRIGKVGFSGQLVADIEQEYTKRVRKYQRPISKAYYTLLAHYAAGVLPEEVTLDAVSIQSYSSIETNNTTER